MLWQTKSAKFASELRKNADFYENPVKSVEIYAKLSGNANHR